MGVQCAIPSCRNASFRTMNNDAKKNVSYHMFPKDEHYKQIWIRKCYRKAPYNYDNAYLCSEHFANDDFVTVVRGKVPQVQMKRKLKPNAIPSRLLSTPIIIEKPREDESKKKRYETRKRTAPEDEVLNKSDNVLEKTAEVNPISPKNIEPPSAKKAKHPDDDIDTEEDLQKILNIVLERIHCLEQELEGLTHIMEDIKGRIEKIQSRC